ncbi:uncharacterized protein LY89DRAFT_390190 [Mollisia scopiformis]|uniref:Uncharacterized protein n=1 Tax=Mollisia scopiformis TaxID=149040 RepID=A0A194XNY6_MOLSC|nr:uncharacterized protein LY89DRAFT_390190 [Mollisia scopiformis]KUJ21955.1 hypothetical protein LY89DRAFT_390190 [Mollisia scopiformis]
MPDPARKQLIVKLPMPSIQTTARPKSLHAAIRQEALKQTPASSTPSNVSEHFSQSQIAIALTICKSKPAGLSTKEYCEQLNRHFKIGQPVRRDQLRYIETAEFWKDQYTSLHLKQKALENQLRCCKEALRLSRKRHHGDAEEDALQDSQHGTDLIRNNQSQPPEDWETIIEENDYLRLSSYALRIRRHRTALEDSAIDSNNLDKINAHSTHTLQLLTQLESALPDCCLPLRLFKDNEDEVKISFSFQQVMNQFALAFLACLASIDDLFRTIPGRAKKTEIVYRMVMLFNRGLNILRTISAEQATHDMAARSHSPQHKRPRIEAGEYLVNKYLANALAAIAHNAQWKAQQPAHCEILEGCLFSILEHTGRLVSEAIFGEHVASSDLPANITTNAGSVVRGFVRPEARYIIQVLHALAGAGDRRGLVTQILAAGKTSLNEQLRATNPTNLDIFGDLLSKSKRLLQITLVKSAVGGADLESLRLPTPPLETSNVATEERLEKYGKEWLIEMVWGIIGWDIVCSK